MQEIDRAYWYCVDQDRWPEGFSPFDAIRDLLREVRGYSQALVAHHDVATLSADAVRESAGGACQICRRATALDADLERTTARLWDDTKDPALPLWWCLRDDLKHEFRDALAVAAASVSREGSGTA